MTAAHCVYNIEAKNLAIIAGISRIKPDIYTENNVYKVKEVFIHPLLNRSSLREGYDIALLRLDRDVVLSDSLNFICLPSSIDDFEAVFNKEAVVLGWGSTDGAPSAASLATELQQTHLTILNDDESSVCFEYNYNSDNLYCVLDRNSTRGSNIW